MKKGILLLVFLSVSCGDGLPTAPTPGVPFTVTGRVIDFTSGTGIPNVALKFDQQALRTDADGQYKVSVPIGNYRIEVEGEPIVSVVLIRGSWTHGDFIAPTVGMCHSRYGLILNGATGRPVAGARVRAGGETVTGPDGWYRQDGCGPCFPCNTAFMYVDAQGFAPYSSLLGRGISFVERKDVELTPAK